MYNWILLYSNRGVVSRKMTPNRKYSYCRSNVIRRLHYSLYLVDDRKRVVHSYVTLECFKLNIFISSTCSNWCSVYLSFFNYHFRVQPADGPASLHVLHAWRSRGILRVKLSMRWCRGWVRTGRVASLSSRCNSRKVQPFGFHFDIFCCRPIPSNVNLSFNFEGHGDHYVKSVMRRRRGWVRTTRVTSLSSRYNSRKA